MGLVLLLVCVLLIVGGLPTWDLHPYGPYPSSLGALVLIILVVLLLTGRL